MRTKETIQRTVTEEEYCDLVELHRRTGETIARLGGLIVKQDYALGRAARPSRVDQPQIAA